MQVFLCVAPSKVWWHKKHLKYVRVLLNLQLIKGAIVV